MRLPLYVEGWIAIYKFPLKYVCTAAQLSYNPPCHSQFMIQILIQAIVLILYSYYAFSWSRWVKYYTRLLIDSVAQNMCEAKLEKNKKFNLIDFDTCLKQIKLPVSVHVCNTF